jgi:hypothetical protein
VIEVSDIVRYCFSEETIPSGCQEMRKLCSNFFLAYIYCWSGNIK